MALEHLCPSPLFQRGQLVQPPPGPLKHTHRCTHTHTHTHRCTHTHTQTHTQTQTHTHTNTHTHTHRCAHTHTHRCAHTHTHRCAHTTHTCKYTCLETWWQHMFINAHTPVHTNNPDKLHAHITQTSCTLYIHTQPRKSCLHTQCRRPALHVYSHYIHASVTSQD